MNKNNPKTYQMKGKKKKKQNVKRVKNTLNSTKYLLSVQNKQNI